MTSREQDMFELGQAHDAEGQTIIVRPTWMTEMEWYWYIRGVEERSRQYADALAAMA